ncbi:MAG: hypothetical protein D6706_04345 [Chloroflexi bacterium]|nr:MAG: hypothetical protein D6706_04345 [Chloroflexota bacterium]
MPTKFDWVTEDESDWEVMEWPQVETAVSSSRFWQRPFYLITLAILVAVVAIGWWQVQLRIRQATSDVKADVEAAFYTVYQAALNKDRELFSAALTAEPVWQNTQLGLLETGLWLDRPSLGLWVLPETAVPLTITLSTDLTTATVTATHAYITEPAPGITDTISLQHVYQFRQKNGNWQLAPLPAGNQFWGEWETDKGEWVTLVFSQRDEDFGRALRRDLDNMISRLCQYPEANCPDRFRLQVRLETTPQSMTVFYQSYTSIFLGTGFFAQTGTPTSYISLPAPTLVGKPTDAAGYQALWRGYGSWIGAVLIDNFLEARNQLEGREYVATLLEQVDLREPPFGSYRPYVSQKVKPPIPFPDQVLLLMCQNRSEIELWQYDPTTDYWQLALSEGMLATVRATGFVSGLAALPDDRGAVFTVQERTNGVARWATWLWQADGQLQKLVESERPYTAVTWNDINLVRTDRFLPLISFDREGNAPAVRMLDLWHCTPDGCDYQDFNGFPVFSPDMRQAIIQVPTTENRAPDLWWQAPDGQRIPLSTTGWGVRWLDNTSFVYLSAQTVQNPEPQPFDNTAVIRVHLDEQTKTYQFHDSLLESEQLLSLLPEPPKIQTAEIRLGIMGLYYNSANAQTLYALAMTDPASRAPDSYLFALNLETGETSLVWHFAESWVMPDFSRSGKYFSAVAFRDGFWRLIVVETAEKTTWELPPPLTASPQTSDWSGNEQWLAVPDTGVLRLVAPWYDFEKQVFHPAGSNCLTAVWVNQ